MNYRYGILNLTFGNFNLTYDDLKSIHDKLDLACASLKNLVRD